MMERKVGTPKRYEEFAYVLDYLPHGKPSVARTTFRAEPIVQVVGETYFTLLEAVVMGGVTLGLHERIYVGKENRDKISHITGRISYDDLTSTAKGEMPAVLEKVVKKQEDRFIDFFNAAQAITPRMHALELLPGVGKKYMWTILGQREREPFASFQDLQERTGIPDPAKLIAKRVMEELTGESKYRVFTRPP